MDKHRENAQHTATLKTMIHQSDDGAICICAECRALRYAIASFSPSHAMTAQAGAVAAAERDARTIYDIACTTREDVDVDFKAIALRNWQHVRAAVSVEALEGLVGDLRDGGNAHEPTDDFLRGLRAGKRQAADELTQLIKEHSNGS